MTESTEKWGYRDSYFSMSYIHPKDILALECDEGEHVDHKKIGKNTSYVIMKRVKGSSDRIFQTTITTRNGKVFNFFHKSDVFARKMIEKIEAYHNLLDIEPDIRKRLAVVEDAIACAPGSSAFMEASKRFDGNATVREMEREEKRKRLTESAEDSMKRMRVNDE